MKIRRRKIDLISKDYSREWDVDRSRGVHLMEVVHYIGKTSGLDKNYDDGSIERLDNFSTPGFLWEHVMSRTDRLEHALGVEAIRMEMIHDDALEFPGEKFWCRECDRVMEGGQLAWEHCTDNNHKGIFSTPDAYDTVKDSYVEWKFRWASSRRSHPKVVHTTDGFWKWPMQCMWNAMTLDTNKATVVVCHVRGDYQGINEPESYEIEFEFTDREIERNKLIITSNAQYDDEGEVDENE